jgi:peptide/nickel transport system substrate-binding protein
VEQRRALSLAFACGSACLLAACADPSARSSPGRSDSPGEPTSVTLLYPGDDLGPAASAPIQYLVFLTLMHRRPDGGLEGRLIRGWEALEEGPGWTVRLRSDLRWQDGAPVTARDVAFTLDLHEHPEVLFAARPRSYDVTVVDDSTYTIRYGETADAEVPPGSPLDWYTPIYPEHLLRDEDPARFYDWDFWRQPVGNGPYRLVRRVPETGLVLEADPDFALGPPKIDRVLIRSGSSPLVELRAGNVDAVAHVPDSDVPKLRADPRYELYHAYNLGSVSAILWNHARPPFDDVRVRRALTQAVDRRSILEILNAPAELEPVDVLFSELQFRTGGLPPGLPYDPEAARALLQASGWVDRDGDGVREREGTPLRFSLLVSRGGGPWFPDHGREAVLVQANLQAVGVAAEILELDPGAARARAQARDFDAAILDIKGGNRPPVFGPDGLTGYRSPRAAALIDSATRAIDRETRARLFAELGEILRRDLPFVVLAPMVSWTAADRRIRGLSSPWRADPAWYMDELWLDGSVPAAGGRSARPQP